jgi:hypothetical protein
MDVQEFDNWLYVYSFMASMSHHYFQIAAGFLWFVDFSIKLTTLVLALLGVIFAVQEQRGKRPKPKPLEPLQLTESPQGIKGWAASRIAITNTFRSAARRLRLWSRFSENWTTAMRVSCWSALFAFVVVCAPFSSSYATHDSMLKQWAVLRADVANLKHDFDREKNQAAAAACLVERQKLIESQVAALDREEPMIFPPLKWYCERAQRIRNGEGPDDEPIRLYSKATTALDQKPTTAAIVAAQQATQEGRE